MTAAACAGQLDALQGRPWEVLLLEPGQLVVALLASCLAPGLAGQLCRHSNLSVQQ